ncbi:MAG: hypothetical protein WKG07_06575 [Hymenobacter sp.]
MLTSFVNQWLDNVKGPTRFAVSEAWFSNPTDLNNAGRHRGRTYSFFSRRCTMPSRNPSNGNAWDMRGLQFAGFTEANGSLSVSFV